MMSGFVIVRKPAFEEINTEGKCLLPVDDVYYRGVDRSMWRDIQDDYYAGRLPIHLQMLYAQLSASDNDSTFIRVLASRDATNLFLDYNEGIKAKNEIIIVSSP